jgi:type I restriction-modification system DNA methylase subunit
MAAINFYIRGLNPANIEQGDSLAKYRPVTDHETKSVILANPPFGAQRDQEAYPDVWGGEFVELVKMEVEDDQEN